MDPQGRCLGLARYCLLEKPDRGEPESKAVEIHEQCTDVGRKVAGSNLSADQVLFGNEIILGF